MISVTSERLRPRSAQAAPDGFIMVAVLWILVALASLASIYAAYVVNTAPVLAAHGERIQVEALVLAGLELTSYRLFAAGETRPARGQFGFTLGRSRVEVEFESEAGRIDLNAASKELLTGLFAVLGGGNFAERYADQVVQWRTPQPAGQGPELARSSGPGPRYAPRGDRFPHAGELRLVAGLPPELVDRVLPFVTVYSGKPQINVLAAPATVLSALPGATPERIAAVIRDRQTAPVNHQALMMLLGPAQSYAMTDVGRTVRVTVHVSPESGRSRRSAAVMLLAEGGPKPFHILNWTDDLDETPNS